MTPDTSGRLFEMPWAVWDPDSSSWRTYAGTSHSGSQKFSGTWPTSGSMRDGACFEHPTWGHPISAPASSSSRLLPTPLVDDAKNVTRKSGSFKDASLTRAITSGDATAESTATPQQGGEAITPPPTLLPTPRAQNGEPRNSKPWIRPLDQPQNLENAVARIPGVLTDPPLNDGKPSTDPHQPPLSTDD